MRPGFLAILFRRNDRVVPEHPCDHPRLVVRIGAIHHQINGRLPKVKRFQQQPARRRIGLVPACQQEAGYDGTAGRQNVNLRVPATARLAYRLFAVFFSAPWASGCALLAVESNPNTVAARSSSDARAVYTRWRTPFFAQRFMRV